jgi:hypothetical protein
MERTALDHIRQKIEEELKNRFPGSAVQQVAVLQYGDDPVIEPGELAVRVSIEAPDGQEGQEQALDEFHTAHRAAIEQFRKDLSTRIPEATRLEFLAGEEPKDGPGHGHGPRIVLARPRRNLEARALAGGDLTPVMTRLGPIDLETLDVLITAGIAPNRAEAVRWALARIRERPAYTKLIERVRELEELKAQF